MRLAWEAGAQGHKRPDVIAPTALDINAVISAWQLVEKKIFGVSTFTIPKLEGSGEAFSKYTPENLPDEYRWKGSGPAPSRWTADDGTVVYRSYADYCMD